MVTDERKPFLVKCDPCWHTWIAAYTPIPVDAFLRVMKGLCCPMCGAGAKQIVMVVRQSASPGKDGALDDAHTTGKDDYPDRDRDAVVRTVSASADRYEDGLM